MVLGLFHFFSAASESFLQPSQPDASYECARGSRSSRTSTISSRSSSEPLHTPPDTPGTATQVKAAPASVTNDEHEVSLQKSYNSNNDSGKQQQLTSSLAITPLQTLATRRHPILPKDISLTILAFLAGISDYICFHRLQLFVIMQTGNFIHSLSSVVEGRWKEAINSGRIVAAYAIGSGIWRILNLALSSSSAVLGTTTLALLLFYWCDAILQRPASISHSAPLVLSLAFGLISSATTTVGGGIISFAYTGHISNAGKYMAERMLLRGKSFKRTPGTSLRMLLGFASGVLSSSLYHQSLLRSIKGESRGTTGDVMSRHRFFVLGIAHTTVLILGGIDLSVSASEGQKETVAKENPSMGLEELISTKLKIRGIGKRRRRGDELDIRVDGWTNIHSGPRSFDDGS